MKNLNNTTGTLLIIFLAFNVIIMSSVKAQQNIRDKFLVEKIYYNWGDYWGLGDQWGLSEYYYDTDNKLLKIVWTGQFVENGQLRDGKAVTVFEYENGRVSKLMFTDSTHFLCNSCDERYFYNSHGQLIRNVSYVNGEYHRHLNFHYQNELMVSTYTDNSYPFQYDTLFYDNSGNVVRRSLGGWREYHYEYDNNPKPNFGLDYLFAYQLLPGQGDLATIERGLSKNNITKSVTDEHTFNYTYNEYGLPDSYEMIFDPCPPIEPHISYITYKQVEVGISEPEMELLDIKVFPNPTTGKLTIEWTSGQVDEWASVEVFDVFGRKMLEQKAEGRKQKENSPPFMEGWQPAADGVVIDISHLVAGVYLVKITTEKGVVVKKVVKQ